MVEAQSDEEQLRHPVLLGVSDREIEFPAFDGLHQIVLLDGLAGGIYKIAPFGREGIDLLPLGVLEYVVILGFHPIEVGRLEIIVEYAPLSLDEVGHQSIGFEGPTTAVIGTFPLDFGSDTANSSRNISEGFGLVPKIFKMTNA